NAANDPARRAAQTVMQLVLDGLAKMLAPVIPFTAEETWHSRKHKGSVHGQELPANVGKGTWNDSNPWEVRLSLRSEVNEKLEQARREKKIGKSLEAQLLLSPKAFSRSFTNGQRDLVPTSEEPSLLEELFIVSKVIIKPAEDDGEEIITVTRAEDHGMRKCVRCCKYWDCVGSDPQHPELCDRCTNVVLNWRG
ncbi:MAG TPA: class I tRNA ligase family protein, partial [Steroidobacteraceae bacterium]